MTDCARCGHSQTLHPQTAAVHGRCMWPVVPSPAEPHYCTCPAFIPPLRLVKS
jgi:hypothetical protein